MQTPKITFSFAPHIAFFYATGFLSKHGGFGPASEKRLELLEKRFPQAKKETQKFTEIADDYTLFTQLKKALLHAHSSVIQNRDWQKYLAVYNRFLKDRMPNSLKKRGIEFTRKLAIQWHIHRSAILQISKKHHLRIPGNVECFVVPNIGEYGEAFGTTIVLSLDFQDTTVAFAVFLEELVHLSVTPQAKKRIRKAIPNTPEPLQEEALVGFLMNQFLRAMEYPDSIREAIVYGWHAGERAKLIRRLEGRFRRKK